MDIFWSTQLSIPMSQIVLLLGLSTLALIYGRIKLALLVNYCFTLYWGYISQLNLLSENGQIKLDSFTLAYFGFGLLVVILALISFLCNRDSE